MDVIMVSISTVRTDEDAEIVRALAWEFVAWLRERYPDMLDMIDTYLKTQKFDEQLAGLLTIFAPPKGECLLAKIGGEPAGIVMLKPHPSGACEMNRMFVRSTARGKGVGLALGQTLVQEARNLGYGRMILSAGFRHDEAIPLYRRLGFAEDKTLPDTGAGDAEVRMALDL
jgi:GNAT superfamily N-acetyltransferase